MKIGIKLQFERNDMSRSMISKNVVDISFVKDGLVRENWFVMESVTVVPWSEQ